MRKTVGMTILIATFAASALAVHAAEKARPGEIALHVAAIHPSKCEAASPAGGDAAALNPPPLLWPAIKGVTYSVQLSSDPSFPKDKTIAAEGLNHAFYNIHQTLQPGTWHWRYATVKGKSAKWSETFSFRIQPATQVFETMSPEAMLKKVPASHPRLLVRADGLEALRERAKDDARAQKMIRDARKLIGMKLMTEKEGLPTPKQAKSPQVKKFAKWAGKALAGKMGGRTRVLARGYILTGDEKIGHECVRHAMHIAAYDAKRGPTSWGVSDFAYGGITAGMAHAYDACYDLLTEEQRETLRKAIKTRMSLMYLRWVNGVETRVFSAHIWQHILHQFVDAAFATVGEIPEADQWASYAYGLWIARVPLMGGNDGGWANGNGYFGTNVASLVEIPDFFRSLTGANLYAHPWYRNSIYYIMYTWPPGQPRAQFGDGGQGDGHPAPVRVAYVDAIGRETDDPYAGWYVNQCQGDDWNKITRVGPLQWYYLHHGIDAPMESAARFFDLPQARVLRDVGLAVMHTDLANGADSLMVGFRSSPYGGFNHAHADQNTFTVNFAGQRIWTKSGYYIAYGDPHFKGWYTASRGSNTVLVDGQGQNKGTVGYGWIPRFLNGDNIAYSLGDATNAYPKELGLKRYRRHVLMLRPRIVVVYDELEASKPVTWTWLAHAIEKIDADSAAMRLATERGDSHSQIDLAASTPVRFAVTHKFDPPADNWRGKKHHGKLYEYADQWHAFVDTAGKAQNARFLAVIQTDKKEGGKIAFRDAKPGTDGWIDLDGWRVRAETDASKQAVLEVRATDGSSAFGYGVGVVEAAGKTFARKADGASVLVDTVGGQLTQQEAVDVLPAAAR